MWLFTKIGFYSVVEDWQDNDFVLVRSRAREDLEELGELVHGLEITIDEKADYLYRSRITKTEWALALASLVDGLDYPNFKDAVGKRDKSRASVYMKIWAIMRHSFSSVVETDFRRIRRNGK